MRTITKLQLAIGLLLLSLTSGAAAQGLSLRVGVTSGDVFIENATGSAVTFDAYEITSQSGALQRGGWLSIADNYDLSGDNSIDDTSEWFELSDADVSIAEGSLNALTGDLLSGERVDLGPIWSTTGAADLLFEYQVNVTLQTAQPEYFLEADLDRNNVVTASDYTVLRDSVGAERSPADVNSDGVVDAADFVGFQQQFGAVNPLAAAASAAVFRPAVAAPEPGAVGLALWPVLLATAAGRRVRRRSAA